jgi:hypothetical protein
MRHFLEQNARIANGTAVPAGAMSLNLGTLGFQNGGLDYLQQGALYADFLLNNTYGIPAITPELYAEYNANFTREPDGCGPLIKRCRELIAERDPNQRANDATTNEACSQAGTYCFMIQKVYTASGRNAFDVTLQDPAQWPMPHPQGFFNRAWVQQALGVPVNFTMSSDSVPVTFLTQTGDMVVRGTEDLEWLLAQGVKMAFMYGDMDTRANCEFSGPP